MGLSTLLATVWIKGLSQQEIEAIATTALGATLALAATFRNVATNTPCRRKYSRRKRGLGRSVTC